MWLQGRKPPCSCKLAPPILLAFMYDDHSIQKSYMYMYLHIHVGATQPNTTHLTFKEELPQSHNTHIPANNLLVCRCIHAYKMYL